MPSLGISRARVLATGARYQTTWANVFSFRDGRICRLLDLYETASVVAALRTGRCPE
jgi:ketosteroid isomerase-like protein